MTQPQPPVGIDWLNSLANFERRLPRKYDGEEFDTARYRRILEALGNPHLRDTPTVQILGTDGKGSTLALLESLLHRAGMTTKSFISPHLYRVEERFRSNGESVSTGDLIGCLEAVRQTPTPLEGLTYFEALNAAFWVWVESERPDFVLLECGLGGRLDTTTLCNASLKIVTRLERDHFKLLGPTMDKIAGEKLAALRPGVPSLIAPQSPYLRDMIESFLCDGGVPHVWVGEEVRGGVVARDMSGWTHRLGTEDFQDCDFSISLLGDHQTENLSSALLAFRHLIGDWPHLENPIRLNPRWRGRCQAIRRGEETWVLDGSHTAIGGQALRGTLDHLFDLDRPRAFYFASTRDRFPWCYLRGLVRPEDRLRLVDFPYERLWKATELRDRLEEEGWNDYSTPTLEVALHDAPFLDQVGDSVKVVCGSLYWTGEALRRLEMDSAE